MKQIKRKFRLFISILAISLWLGTSSCDILIAVLDEMATTEQTDNTKKTDGKSKTKDKTNTNTKTKTKTKTQSTTTTTVIKKK